MPASSAFRLLALLGALASAAPPPGRHAVFLFGPSGAESARLSARAAASAARRWLSAPGATAELCRAGNPDALPLQPKVPDKPFEQAFLDAARDARETDPAVFIASLDAAAQALARKSGTRLLVAILESPPFSGEAENALQQIVEICRANSIRVVVLDPAAPASKDPKSSLGSLAFDTGGALVRNPKTLDTSLLATAAGPTASPVFYAAKPVPAPSGDLIVRTRFIRTSPRGTQTWGTQRSYSGGVAGISTQEGGANTELATGPLRGLLMVESPLSSLKFQTDEPGQTYLARALVTQVVRNAGGRIVWQAKKEVVFRGPLRRLDARRAGSLYYMREVQLPAGRYTIEAAVEDLIAGKSGAVSIPLTTGDGLPGFTVSDALLVRPFNSAADRFEADQVFSYDGEALSPLLDPVFESAEPFNLQIYFVIYPDLLGAQPEISLELLHNGRVVGRAPVPFTDKLRDTSREGIGSMSGEQKRQFPYLATLRNPKLSPGQFEARVTVRQGRNVITRAIPFRVHGDGETPAQPVAVSSGSSDAPAADDAAGFAMPEIDPVSVGTGGPSVPAADLRRMWDEAAATALDFSRRLPNFRCNQETRRLTAPIRNPDQFRESDVIVDELIYENGKETYQPVSVNGLKSNRQRKPQDGVRSKGEFGSMLKGIFGPQVSASYKWAGRAMTAGVLCRVFEVEVQEARSNFVLQHNLRQEVAGYRGRVFIEEETGLVRRLTIQGGELPKDFPIKSPSLSLEYGLVRVGEQDYLLPLRSVLQLRQGKTLVRNETVFRNYRRFEASSQIRF